jgi:hypothetical protein
MAAARFTETLVTAYITARCHNTESCTFLNSVSNNIKNHINWPIDIKRIGRNSRVCMRSPMHFTEDTFSLCKSLAGHFTTFRNRPNSSLCNNLELTLGVAHIYSGWTYLLHS